MSVESLAAACVDPSAPSLPWPDGEDPGRVLALLRANKIPLLDLAADTLPGPLRESAAWRKACEEETGRREEQVVEFDRIATLLRAAGIVGTLFKSHGSYPYRSSNLDLLVPPSRFDHAARVLVEAGHLEMPHYREAHKRLFHRFRAGRSILSVHLHETISWGQVVILDGEGVAARAGVPAGGSFAVASAEDRVIATLAHSLYETDQVRLSDLRAVRLASRAPGFSWRTVVSRVRDRGWVTGFWSILVVASALEARLFGGTCVPGDLHDEARAALGRARWAGLYATRRARRLEDRRSPVSLPLPISRIYSKAHFIERLCREPRRRPDERMTDLCAMVWNLTANRFRLRCRPAVIVSVSGLDGAGKSTVVDAIRDAMTLCEIPVKVVWSRGGFGRSMEAIKRRGRAMLPLPSARDAAGKGRLLGNAWMGALFAWSILAEQVIHHVLRVRLPRMAGWSVVCDRYAWDTGADLIVKMGKRAPVRVAANLLIGLSRTPDLAILLDLSPGEARARKPDDLPPGSLDRHHEALESFVIPCGMRRIDAARTREAVIDEAVTRALRASFARFSRTGTPAEGGAP